MAGFGWIDFSKEHRDRVFSVVKLLKDGGTVDELGIGVIRDSIADWLFPGVSTIQTRPKYFVILLQIFNLYLQKYSSTSAKAPTLAKFLEDEEYVVMKHLYNSYNGKDGNGVIGIDAVRNKRQLVRLPSSIYWNGLRIHNFINTTSSLSEYLALNNLSSQTKESSFKGDNEEDDKQIQWNNFSLKHLHSKELDESIKLELSAEEADFISDQFKASNPLKKNDHNLLSELLKNNELSDIILESNSFEEFANSILNTDILNSETQKMVRLALDFNLLIHGAHIRYNILLKEKGAEKDFTKNWIEWLEEFENRITSEIDFNFVYTEIATNTPSETKTFLEAWQKEMIKPEADIKKLDALVKNQEIKKKGKRAKLIGIAGEYPNWVGINKLEYRFGIVKTIIKDITDAKLN